MTDDLPVPPNRDIPPDVRERLRSAVVSSLDDRPRRSPLRGPVTAVLGVAVLVTGGLLATTRVWHVGQHGQVAGATIASAPSAHAVPADVTRCAGALAAARLDTAWPDPGSWRPVFDVSDQGRHVTAVLVGGRPMFCETTLTTVTVSSPGQVAAVPTGSTAAVLLGSDDGVVAGVVRSGTAGLDVDVQDGAGSHQRTAMVSGGLFVAFGPPHGVRRSQVTVSASADTRWSTPLRTPAPVVFRTDRPERPGSDGADDPCVGMPAEQGGPVLDATSWRRGAEVGNKVVVDYNSAAAALCDATAKSPDFRYLGPLPATGTPLELAYRADRSREDMTLAGLVAPNVGRVDFTTTTGTDSARIVGPTFAVKLDVQGDEAPDVRVTVTDRSGNRLYQGPLPAPVKEG